MITAATKIRPATASDAEAIANIYRHYVEHTSITFEVDPPSPTEFAERITKVTTKFPWLICEYQGKTVGYAYACLHRERAAYRWSVDTAVYVDTECRGKALGRLLYERLIPEVRSLGYYNAFAGITLPNERSVKLHENVGFKSIGVYKSVGYKQGSWHDVGWWQLQLREYSSSPTEPRNWGHPTQSPI